MIEQFEYFTGTLKFRRSDALVVRPECEAWDGRTITVMASWQMEPDDHRYPDEWAMMVMDRSYPRAWVASGDLVGLKPADAKKSSEAFIASYATA